MPNQPQDRPIQDEVAQKETAAAPESPLLPKIVRFKDLARCGDEVWIEHDGQLYRLRRTRLGKLILTK